MKKLSRGEMKKITGGSCIAQGAPGSGVGIIIFNGDSGNSQAASSYAAANGTHWCCASCNTASWMQPYIQN